MNVDTYLKHMEEEERERAESPWYIRIPLNIKDFVWYRIICRIPDLPDEIKWKWQRITKGYCDCDVWGVDNFIIEKAYRPLKEFIEYNREKGHSLPMEFIDNSAGWQAVLDKIAYSFDCKWREDHSTIEDMDAYYAELKAMTKEEKDEHYKKVQEGFELFGKHFCDLWD
jgi:hypothetical protein